jgi:putative addiction module CopG family antidote
MTIDLTPAQEQFVNEQLKSGHFRSAEEVITEALQVLRDRSQPSDQALKNNGEREAVRAMLEFVQENRVRLDGVSVKALIREGQRW